VIYFKWFEVVSQVVQSPEVASCTFTMR